MKLYEISNELMAILDSDEEVLNSDIAAELAKLELALEEKVESVLQYRQGLLLESEALKQEAERLKERSDRLLRKSEWLKSYVHHTLSSLGVGKVSTRTFTATVAKSPPKLEISADCKVPFEFIKEKVETSIDKAALMAAIKGGLEPPAGVQVVESTHLRIS